MAEKTWDNVPCRFWTQNTVNKRGNSEYRVWSNRLLRHAPINAERKDAQDQVFNFKRRAICYLKDGSTLYNLIMSTPNDNEIKIDSVANNQIFVNVKGVILPAKRRPEEGLITFDFANHNGDLSGIHVGHAVCKLKIF
jgi:hypothetical protein